MRPRWEISAGGAFFVENGTLNFEQALLAAHVE